MKCLLVDDEPGIREGLAALLRRRGHEVATAGDCRSARDRLAERPFDVVVTDWRLPDGLAATFLGSTDAPVVAVSGHPEEVETGAGVVAVLAKPVTPARLLEAIAAACAAGTGDPVAAGSVAVELPCDVRRVLDDARRQLPDALAVECRDDGTFVVLEAALPPGLVPTVRPTGGDLRVVPGPAGRRLELRLCRDGRPDPAMAVVRVDEAWPQRRELAVDCHGVAVDRDRLSEWLERARLRAAAGGLVRFLNVPDSLCEFTAGWERAHDLPMRARVGPSLSAELAELWS